MALNVTQVNQAFLGLLGRPATGAEAAKFAGQLDAATLAQTLLTDASFKNELSVETLSFKTVDLLNTDPAAFVESLYTALLGRASDAEGKAFWLSVAGATPNRADVVSQFIAAVQAQEGTADANAFATIQAEDKALASAWVESLYNNLAGRASDAEGLDFWTNAIVSFTMTPAQVAASFAAALALQGNTTEDGQNYLAKLGVADNFTASFKDFNALITANEKAEQLKNLVTMMNGVNKDSQVDQYVEEITKNMNEFQNIKAIQFTTADDDDLGIDPETGESNLTGAANFTGTYNLTDATKGTIQSTDSATGTEAYLTDTLTVNVTGYDKTTHDTFNLENLPNTSSVEKLVINNGAASVNGSVNADFQYINVNGTGSFNIDATTSNADGFKDIVLNSAANKDNSFKTTQALSSIKTGAGNDDITIGTYDINNVFYGSTVAKSISTGAGDDIVRANLGEKATADLGAGDDTFLGVVSKDSSVNAGAGDDVIRLVSALPEWNKDGSKFISSIKIDGGTGSDTLDLSTGVTPLNVQITEYRGIESIRGIEKLKVGTGTQLAANAISGQKIELSGNSLVLDAQDATSIDLSKFTNAKDEDVQVLVNNVKTGTINLASGNKDFNLVKETISLTNDATKVSVKGFEKNNDHMSIANATADNATLFKTVGNTDVIDTSVVAANKIYFVNLDHKFTKAGLNDALAGAKFNLQEKDVFYIVATDSTDVGGNGKNSTAKIYKVEVGKDQTVAKVDQVATVNVADKAQLSIGDFYNTPVPVENVGVADVTVVDGTLDLSGKVISDANAEFNIDLSTNPNVATITSVKLPAGVTAKNLVISGANSATPVTVEVSANSTIETLTIGGVNNQTTPYNVVVDASAKVSAISTNNADNSIDISALPAGTVKVVNAGEGNDTLKIAGTSADNLTEMNSVERVEFTGTSINADAIVTNNNSVSALAIAQMKSATTQELEIKVGQNNNIDLSKLVQATDDSGDASLKITGVKDGNVITLTTTADVAHTFAETVALGTAKNVTVKGIATGDKVVSDSFSGITGGFKDLGAGSLTANGAFFKASNAATAAAAQTEANTAAATLASGKAILALNGTANATYIFEVNNGVATLVATVNDSIDAKDSIANGEITFDNGIVPPAPAKTYDFVKDLGSPASITVGKEYNGTLVEFDSDGLLSISNIDRALEIKSTGVTAANTINLVSSADNINFKIKVPTIATTSLTLAADATVSTAPDGIDTLVLNGSNELKGTVISALGKAKATIETKNATDSIKVTEPADFTGITGKSDINVEYGATAFAVTKGKTYTGNINLTLKGDASGETTLASSDNLAFANSVVATENLLTLNVSGAALTTLKNTQIDLAQSSTSVVLGDGFSGDVNLNEWFTNVDGSDDFSGTLASVRNFVGTAGNENISFVGNAAIKKIDGGEGTDTITLGSGTAIVLNNLTEINNVEKIIINNGGAVSLNAAALNGVSGELTISGANTVTLNATDATEVNLSSLTVGAESASTDLKIANVTKKAVVTLSDDFSEAVSIANNQTGQIDLSTMIQNAKAGDAVAITLSTKATSLKGSDAIDNVTISGDFSLLSALELASNDILTVTGTGASTKVNSSVITGGEFIVNGSTANQVLNITANSNDIDLSSLKAGTDAVDINISGLKSDNTITLNSGDGMKETITISGNGTVEGVSISGLSGKNADSDIISITGLAGTSSAQTGLASGSGAVISATDADNLTAAEAKWVVETSGTAAAGGFLVAKDVNSSAVYLINTSYTSQATSVDLVKIVSFNGVAEFSGSDIVIG